MIVVESRLLNNRYGARRIERVIKANYSSRWIVDGIAPKISSDGKDIFPAPYEMRYETVELALKADNKISNARFVAPVAGVKVVIF